MEYLGRIFKYLKNYKLQIALILLVQLLYAFFSIFTLTLLVPFLQVLFQQVDPVTVRPAFSFSPQYVIDSFYYGMGVVIERHGQGSALIFIAGVMILLSLLSNLCRYAGMYWLSHIRSGILSHIRDDFYRKLIRLPLSFYTKQRSGDIPAVRFHRDLPGVTVAENDVSRILIDGAVAGDRHTLQRHIPGLSFRRQVSAGHVPKKHFSGIRFQQDVLRTEGLQRDISGIGPDGQAGAGSFRQIDRDLRFLDIDPEREAVLFPFRLPDPKGPVHYRDLMPAFLVFQTDYPARSVFRRKDHHILIIGVHGNGGKRLVYRTSPQRQPG